MADLALSPSSARLSDSGAVTASNSTGFTVTGWVRCTNTASTSSLTFLRIDGGTTSDITCDFRTVGGVCRIRLITQASGYAAVNAFSGATDDDWFFVALTVDGTTATLYISDDFATLGSSATNTQSSTWDVTEVELCASGTAYFVGYQHHFRVWADVLTEAEILAEMASKTHVLATNLEAAWELDEAALTDSSGNGYDLTVEVGSVSSAPEGAPVPSGGYALQIDSKSIGLTTSDIGLAASRQLAFDSKLIGLTTADIGLAASRHLNFDSKSIGLTTSDIGLSVGLSLALDSKSIGLTSSDIGLAASRHLNFDSKSIGLTTSDIGLSVGLSLQIDSKSIGLTSSDISLVLSRHLNFDSKSIGLTAFDIGLIWSGGSVSAPEERTLVVRTRDRLVAATRRIRSLTAR